MSPEREQRIRMRAYGIWERAGRPDGRSIDHWIQAEREIAESAPSGFTDDGKPIWRPSEVERGGAPSARQ